MASTARLRLLVLAALALACGSSSAAGASPVAPPASAPRSAAEILRDAPDAAWRRPDPNDLLVMTLPSGPVVIELAQRFAPLHAANIRKLVAQHYFDGLAVVRVQDNFVAQWADPESEAEQLPASAPAPAGHPRPLGDASATLPPEFSIPLADVRIARLEDRDTWAPVTGFVDGFPVAADPKTGRAWIAHCYGIVGAGRGDALDSGNGAELYAVIGQSPRALDLNIAPVGRVLQGMERLASLPRGGAAMGFYGSREQDVPILRVELAAATPPQARPDVRVLRTDTAVWAELVDARRRRRDAWYVHPPGAVDLCSLAVPVRIAAPPAAAASTPR
jgi:peptidylprolyl isomerase